MTDASKNRRLTVWALALVAIAIFTYVVAVKAGHQPRDVAFQSTLQSLAEDPVSKVAVAAIREAHEEARQNAIRWSGAYWSCIFLAAIMSALAGLILKLEWFIETEKLKKDLAAIFAVAAALLITISSSGDFEHKRHANRIAAADIEALGFRFVAASAEERDPNTALLELSRILRTRHQEVADGGARTAGDQKESSQKEAPKSAKKSREPKAEAAGGEKKPEPR